MPSIWPTLGASSFLGCVTIDPGWCVETTKSFEVMTGNVGPCLPASELGYVVSRMHSTRATEPESSVTRPDPAQQVPRLAGQRRLITPGQQPRHTRPVTMQGQRVPCICRLPRTGPSIPRGCGPRQGLCRSTGFSRSLLPTPEKATKILNSRSAVSSTSLAMPRSALCHRGV